MSTTEAMRAPTAGDAADVARLMSEHSPEPMDEDGVLRTWTSPNVDLPLDGRLEDGRGYALVERLDEDLWFLAVEGEEPAGFALCHPHPADGELGWVGELGVRRSWRRRGVGRALLLHAFAAFRESGFARAALGVDAESLTGANRLYERAGMRVAARFDIYEKRVA